MITRPPRPVGMQLNLAPMVDVMMCLIIFFLLGSKLVERQHQPVQLPYAIAAQEVNRSELGARVVINVRPAEAAGEPRAEYVVSDWDGRDFVERVLEPAELRDYVQRWATRAARLQQDLRCVIRADKNVTYGDVEVVLRSCGLAKIAKVVFSANAGTDPEES